VLIEEGTTAVLRDDLILGQNAPVTVNGTLVIPFAGDRTILAGSFNVGPTGRIELEPYPERVDNRGFAVKAPALTVSVIGSAVIAGTIDLSGVGDVTGDGVSGADIDIFADSISVPGMIRSRGEIGKEWCTGGFPSICLQVRGGNGGRVRLFSRTALTISGALDVNGGDSDNTGGGGLCWNGGDGGNVELNYATSIDLAGATIAADYGIFYGGCSSGSPRVGVPGYAEAIYRGSGDAPVAPAIGILEVEPNTNENFAQSIPYLNASFIAGEIWLNVSDEWQYDVGFNDGSTHELYDFYTFNFPLRDLLLVQLDFPANGSRLGLVMVQPDLLIVDAIAATEDGETVSLVFDNAGILGGSAPPLTSGQYLVAVSRARGTAGTSYDLTVAMVDSTPAAAPPIPAVPLLPGDDSDGDGIADTLDNCPAIPNASQQDTDSDGQGDPCDADVDGDGVPNQQDAFPNDPTETTDTDRDGIGDNADPDDDNDGVPDAQDDFPLGRFDDARPGDFAFTFIEALARAGVTGGCGGNDYCPDDPVTRAQMAVFLERGMRGSDFSPPAATGNTFLDVGANDFAAAWIEQFFLDGITGGCGGNNYCPDNPVTRAQMAVFLLRAKHGAGYSPPPASGIFNDVPLGSFAVAWIEQLAAEGITGGCGGGNYCPNNPVTRAQMAVFLVRTFGL
jgi:hypothetical protein